MLSVQDPIIPIYLDQGRVFDLLAMLQGGIWIQETEKTVTLTKEQSELSGRAQFGLGPALASLLKMDVSGLVGREALDQTSTEQGKERYHTSASLLFALRQLLNEKGYLTQFDPSVSAEDAKFVEFSSVLARNPLLSAIDSLRSFIPIAQSAHQIETPTGKNRNKKGLSPQEQALKGTQSMLAEMSEHLRAGESVDVIATDLTDGFRAVVTLDIRFLNDPQMSDLVDGHFTVLGKVIRRFDSGDAGSIDLLRKTPFSSVENKQLETVFRAFESMDFFDFDSVNWTVHSPVVHVLPVAIFA